MLLLPLDCSIIIGVTFLGQRSKNKIQIREFLFSWIKVPTKNPTLKNRNPRSETKPFPTLIIMCNSILFIESIFRLHPFLQMRYNICENNISTSPPTKSSMPPASAIFLSYSSHSFCQSGALPSSRWAWAGLMSMCLKRLVHMKLW